MGSPSCILLRIQNPTLHSFPLSSSSSSSSSSLYLFRIRRVARAELPEAGSQQSSSGESKKPAPPSKGAGFGSTSTSSSDNGSKKKNRKGRERGAIIRRSPIQRPSSLLKETTTTTPPNAQQGGANESAFLLTWAGLGILIILEGLALSASGFLPEEWDALFVKYLYPSFTPTVFLFVCGTVVYGVVKYLQGEKMNS